MSTENCLTGPGVANRGTDARPGKRQSLALIIMSQRIAQLYKFLHAPGTVATMPI